MRSAKKRPTKTFGGKLTILDELRAAGEDYDDVLWDRDLEPIKKDLLSKHRWYSRVREIYQDGTFYFAVEYSEPATEYQEGQETNPKFYEVRPVEKKIIDYVPIAKAL